MKLLRYVAMLLIIVGALNWGLVGFFQYDLVADWFGGPMSKVARLIYSLIGLSGVWGIGLLFRGGKGCCSGGCGCGCNCCSKGDGQQQH